MYFKKKNKNILSKNKNIYNIYSKLLNNRIIFLTGYIEDEVSNTIITQLLYLESQNKKKDIYMYINSPGGVITSGMSIYDTMKFIQPKINTICIGQACSMAAILLSSGEKNKRFSLPSSRIMIHQPLGRVQGQVSDIEIHAKEIINIKKKIINLLSINTGQKYNKIKIDIERDKFLSPKKALKYGIIDKIITKRKYFNKKKNKI